MLTLWSDRTRVACDTPGCDDEREVTATEPRLDIFAAGCAIVRALGVEGWVFEGFDRCACPTHAGAQTAGVR